MVTNSLSMMREKWKSIKTFQNRVSKFRLMRYMHDKSIILEKVGKIISFCSGWTKCGKLKNRTTIRLRYGDKKKKKKKKKKKEQQLSGHRCYGKRVIVL